ncbi:DNA-binding transcriptional regulator, GntR family [Alkalibacterium subtropicum]|uniref:DNA-binding transcriptional regulator, GntR family n=1 Tax=Alkalibacterium subtropicum TaxID=753702 RepID=A0A1I1HME0_9LACT|nr:GntR family transcriptional regulator [Alkalibacterium subtropicum]SFC25104.1 DNA-binding transcriptional regulator, GntR family [Alkalibacterium subtropicum]
MKKMNKMEAKAYTFMISQMKEANWTKGKQLKELDISRQLEISRTPVRRALNRLIEEGYVYRIPNKGVFVGDISLDLNQRKERIYFLEALLQHIFYTLQLDEVTVDTVPLTDLMDDLKETVSLKSDDFEALEIKFWRLLLAYHSNRYMNERVIETMLSLYQDSSQTPIIFKKSRAMKVTHYAKLIEWLNDNNYTYARREIRILLNQILINLIQGIDD